MVSERLRALEDEEQKINLSRFFKTGKGQYGEGDMFLGIKVPQTRAIVKECWRDCSDEEMALLLQSPYHEERLCALLILVQKFRHCRTEEGRKAYVDFYLANTDHINNWDLVDLSCYEILGVWLLDKDRSMLYDLAVNGRNLWEQRIAMVSCMQFVRHGQLEDCFGIADLLLYHPHDLMHKAVGWLLREAGKRDEARLKEFLRPRYRTMPRTALRYAIEKFSEEERQDYLKGRI